MLSMLTYRANKKVSNVSLLMEMNLHLGPLHSVCTFIQGHKHVIPVSPVKFRPRHPKEHHLFWMMKVHVHVDELKVLCFVSVW